jgi:hypothetical protein
MRNLRKSPRCSLLSSTQVPIPPLNSRQARAIRGPGISWFCSCALSQPMLAPRLVLRLLRKQAAPVLHAACLLQSVPLKADQEPAEPGNRGSRRPGCPGGRSRVALTGRTWRRRCWRRTSRRRGAHGTSPLRVLAGRRQFHRDKDHTSPGTTPTDSHAYHTIPTSWATFAPLQWVVIKTPGLAPAESGSASGLGTCEFSTSDAGTPSKRGFSP